MLDPLMCPQRATRLIPLRISSAGTVVEGSQHASASKTATGTYTVTLTIPSARTVVILGVVAASTNAVNYGTPSTTGVTGLLFKTDAGTATDTDFHLTLLAFDAADQR